MFVESQSLVKRYGDFTALDHFTFSVQRGEVVGLLGPNGAGKTTLLRLLMGYLRPSGGTATIDGLDCHRQSFEVHQRVSYLPGEARLFRTMRGREIVDFFTSVRRDGSRARAVALATERFGLDLSRPVSAMSTGMRQKLALAVTLGRRHAAGDPGRADVEPRSHRAGRRRRSWCSKPGGRAAPLSFPRT